MTDLSPTAADPVADLEARGAAHTAREIAQQPGLWEEVAATVRARRDETDAWLAPLRARAGLRIVLTGAGTSAFAGQVLAPALARALRVRVDAVASTDIVADPRSAFAEDLPTVLVSFARSGDSPESVAATELADACLTDVHHLVVTCNADGLLARRHRDAPRSLVLQMPAAANDQGFAMTSSFTCMTLATWLTLAQPDDPDVAARLARAGHDVLDTRAADVREVADRGFGRVVHLGSGALTGLARESALKLLELTAGATVAFADSSLGFRHGPKAVLDDHTLAVVYLSNDPYTRRYDEDIAVELQQTLGPDAVVVVAARPSDRVGDARVWSVPGLDEADDVELALPYVVTAQLLALHSSLAHGRTPDNPFPSGEVNRVVQGVSVHPFPGGD